MVAAADASVVICAYSLDRWSWLGAAIASVQAQRPAPKELILVIDHNEDMLARARATYPDVVVVANDEERGLSGARNTGISRARGDVVAFLDDDAVAADDWLERLLAGFGPRVAGVGGSASPLWTVAAPSWFPEEFGWVVGCSYTGLPAGPAPVRNMIGVNMSARRALFDPVTGVGGFVSGIGRVGSTPVGCEETEWCIRVRQRFPELEFVYVPDARVHHHVAADRHRRRYFLSRCWHEGRSKAAVAEQVGAGDALTSERTYARTVLPRGAARGVRAASRGDVHGLQRAAAIVSGAGLAAGGYATEWMRRTAKAVREREEVAA